MLRKLLILMAMFPLLGAGQYTVPTYSAGPVVNPTENIHYVSGSYNGGVYITGNGNTSVTWTATVSCNLGDFVVISVENINSAYTGLTWSANNGATISSSSDYLYTTTELVGGNHIANCPTGTTTITIVATSISAYGIGIIHITRWTGLFYNAFDAAGSFISGSGSAISCSASAAAANELIVATDYTTSGAGQSGSGLPSGWSLLTVSGNSDHGFGYNPAGASGSNTFTTTVGSSSWFAMCAAYK
jgi:hypothetical protein